MTTLALTDRNTAAGTLRFATTAVTAGICPVFGVDAAVAPLASLDPATGRPRTPMRILTAIAVNIERLSGQSATEEPSPPRPPTAFQTFLDQNEIPRSKSWRTLGS
ncbi:hypothetical protein ACIRP7_41500 [Streptomyces sp. NPDC102270]|uniref:hypothetical protein n=1 Tax=Streptomyces sp. NPDC102270 TaxID=3366150 RepID=UPI0038189991